LTTPNEKTARAVEKASLVIVLVFIMSPSILFRLFLGLAETLDAGGLSQSSGP
jgi:hypothetical protein